MDIINIVNLLKDMDGNGTLVTDEAAGYKYLEVEYGDGVTMYDKDTLHQFLRELDGVALILTDQDDFDDFADTYLEFPFILAGQGATGR